MKLEVATAAATKIFESENVTMAVVEEGLHAEDPTEIPSYGYCPLDAVKILYKYGKVVKVIN